MVCVGPVAPTSACAWIDWTEKVLRELRAQPAWIAAFPPELLDDVDCYVASWAGVTRNGGRTFQWQAEVHPDELEYLTNALYNVDMALADEARRCPGMTEPPAGRLFHLVLVQALLFSLGQEGPSRAAFVDQLRPSWPVTAGVE